MTVPNLDQAHRFFVEVLGCEYLYRLGPFGPSPDIAERLGVAPNTQMRELRFFRLGGQAILEVFEYVVEHARSEVPTNSDVGGHHLAFYVEDLDAAIAGLATHGISTMGPPTDSKGASLGQRWVYFKAPWGLQCELVSYPSRKAFDHDPTAFA